MKLNVMALSLCFLVGSVTWAGGGGVYLTPEEKAAAKKEKEVKDAQTAEAVKNCKGYSTQALIGFLEKAKECKFTGIKKEIKRQPLKTEIDVISATCGDLKGLKIPYATVRQAMYTERNPLQDYRTDFIKLHSELDDKLTPTALAQLQAIPSQHVRDILIGNYKAMQKECDYTVDLIYIDPKPTPQSKFQGK